MVWTKVTQVEMVGSRWSFEGDPTRFSVELEVEIESKELRGNFNILGISNFKDTIDSF